MSRRSRDMMKNKKGLIVGKITGKMIPEGHEEVYESIGKPGQSIYMKRVKVVKIPPVVKPELKLIKSNSSDLGYYKKGLISIIIPYMHTKERLPLLYACLKSIPEPSEKLEICIHETGPERHLFNLGNIKYKFTRSYEPMNRAWSFNVAVRDIAIGDKLVMMDADLIVGKNWFKSIKSCEHPSVGWKVCKSLSEKDTDNYLKTGEMPKKFIRTRTPAKLGAAGGIGISSREVFYKVGGITEAFEGWGGEDNVHASKLEKYGYNFKTTGGTIYHLYHPLAIHRVKKTKTITQQMVRWDRKKWNDYNKHNTWGKTKEDVKTFRNINPERNKDDIEPIIELVKGVPGVREDTFRRILNSDENLLSLAMLSWLRTEKLLRCVKHWNECRFIKTNLSLRVQASEKLDEEIKNEIKMLGHNFNNSNIYFTDGNEGSGVPRRQMVYDAVKFDTPYIMTTDDDMLFPLGSVELMISILEDNKKLGAIGMWHPAIWKMTQDKTLRPVMPKRNALNYVDAMGSATMITRREVYETCTLDPNYYIGWGDFDFCMQMQSNKWKLATIIIDNFHAVNNSGGCEEYSKHRGNLDFSKKSANYFYKKWGVKIAAVRV